MVCVVLTAIAYAVYPISRLVGFYYCEACITLPTDRRLYGRQPAFATAYLTESLSFCLQVYVEFQE